ncbi:MAG: hypothetical protein FWF29_06565 [Treponema sp.]|nr:hypothetical protein [Treponema sp.]
MDREQFKADLESVPVYDAHTHLAGGKLCAANFWEIVHYFWFLRELQGAGYPNNYPDYTEGDRIDVFLRAFGKTRGTGMHYAVKRIFKDLYGLEITDKKSVYDCIGAVKGSFANPAWAHEVTKKGNIQYAVVNKEEDVNFAGFPACGEPGGICVWTPRIDGLLNEALKAIESADTGERAAVVVREKDKLLGLLSAYRAKGARAVMTTLRTLHKKTWQNSGEKFEDPDDCYIYLLHAVCAFAEEHGFTVQFFLGVEHGWCGVAVPVNNNERVLNLYGLFEKYRIKFDLVIASEANNMDAVQAAHIFPNVYVGGMWWFNFRPSTYTDAMAKRFEVLASTKTYLSISDSRCIEWCYGKNALIKKLAADFLCQKVNDGFVDYNEALEIARDWLFTTPGILYGTCQN